MDHAPPSFDLLVRRNSAEAPLPNFKKNPHKTNRYPNRLTFVKSAQCPYAYVMDEEIQKIGGELGVPVRIVKTTKTREAQSLPCAYGTMGLFYDGELLTYHPTNKKKIIEMVEARM